MTFFFYVHIQFHFLAITGLPESSCLPHLILGRKKSSYSFSIFFFVSLFLFLTHKHSLCSIVIFFSSVFTFYVHCSHFFFVLQFSSAQWICLSNILHLLFLFEICGLIVGRLQLRAFSRSPDKTKRKQQHIQNQIHFDEFLWWEVTAKAKKDKNRWIFFRRCCRLWSFLVLIFLSIKYGYSRTWWSNCKGMFLSLRKKKFHIRKRYNYSNNNEKGNKRRRKIEPQRKRIKCIRVQ